MDTFVVLYKDGVASPPLHPVDAGGWIGCGWSMSSDIEPDQTEPDVPEKIAIKKTTAQKAKVEG
jgi:hypothetical protein